MSRNALSFIHLDRANAISISRNILEALSDPLVSLDPSQIRGQAYDGASMMSSEMAGVQAKIKEISPRALYTHCYSHCLNLAIAASCNVQEVRNLISLINESYLFLSNSPKRERLFELTVKEFLPSSAHRKLPGLCKTRWVERHSCFEVFLKMYEAFITFLDAILFPNEYPQLASLDGSWNRDSVPRKTSIQRNRSNTPSTSPQEHYKRSVAIPLIDCFISQLENRFNGDGRHAHVLLCLIPSVILDSKEEVAKHIDDLLYWKEDLPCSTSLASELRRWQSLWQQEEDQTSVPNNLLLALGVCDTDSFPNIHCLFVIGCTLPITSAEAERSFSLFRRIKTYTRSTPTSDHLSDLAVIAMHFSERISVDEILHVFIQAHPRRLFQSTLFTD